MAGGRHDDPADFSDDCASLRIDAKDKEEFNHLKTCLHSHCYEFIEASV